jgi:hypothetical protein
MAVRNNDFTTIYRDARTDFAMRGVAILASAMRRLTLFDPAAHQAFEAALADLEEAARWGSRAGQAEDAAQIRALYMGKK